jgi:hypothetical protein
MSWYFSRAAAAGFSEASLQQEQPAIECGGWWSTESGICRVANGVAHRVDRLKALGNGQVPAVVELAIEIIQEIEP